MLATEEASGLPGAAYRDSDDAEAAAIQPYATAQACDVPGSVRIVGPASRLPYRHRYELITLAHHPWPGECAASPGRAGSGIDLFPLTSTRIHDCLVVHRSASW